MCGILGSLGKPLSTSEVSQWAKTLYHRGPDEIFSWSNQTITLIVTRLAIQDVETQKQPFFSEDGRYVCIFNGEIYNHSDLRKQMENKGHIFSTKSGDGEVIVHLFEEVGTECFNFLDGMFGGCLIDLELNSYYLFRDFFGIKPLYYSKNENKINFSSEIMRYLSPNMLNLRKNSINDFFNSGYISDSKTLFNNINQVKPGTFIHIDKNLNIEEFNFYKEHIFENSQSPRGFKSRNYEKVFLNLLEKNVKNQIPTDVDFGCFLSGGIDSSLVALFAARHAKKQIDTFTVTYPEINSEGKNSDLFWADYVADKIQSQHHHVPITSNDIKENFNKIVESTGEPFGGVFTSFFLSEYAGKNLKVCLTGDGADELFGGYIHSRLAHILDSRGELADSRDFSFIGISRELYLRTLGEDSEADRRNIIRNFFAEDARDILNTQYIQEMDSFNNNFNEKVKVSNYPSTSKFRQALAIDLFDLLPNNILFYADRFSMNSSLEIRPPFLNKDLFEFSKTLPDNLLVRERITKYILKRAACKFFPREMVFRKKEGFVMPIDFWLRNELKNWALQKLDSNEHKINDLFNSSNIQKLAHHLERNSGDYRTTRAVWKIIVFKQWLALNPDVSILL